MSKVALLTGEPKIGKTTALKKIVNAIDPDRCGGFYTEEVLVNGARRGFNLVTLDGRKETVADVDFDSEFRVGKYGVILECIESFGVSAIYEAIRDKDVIVIDEIGPMQLFSENFRNAVLSAINSEKVLVGTIVLRSFPWADELKKDSRIRLYHLTKANRDDVVEELSSTLRPYKV